MKKVCSWIICIDVKWHSGRCTRFLDLRPEFKPHDWQWLYVKRYGGRPFGRWFSPGTSVRLTPLTINDPFSLISIPPTYFLLSCRTCLLIINIWVMFNAQFFYQNCWHCKVGRYPVNTLLIRNIVLALSFACILPPISRLHQPHPGHCSDSQHWVQIMLTSYPLFHVYIVVIVDIAMLADVDFKSLFLNLVYIVHIITTQCCPTSRRHCVYTLPPLSC